MRTVTVRFSAVPVGGFLFIPGPGWLVKTSRRTAMLSSAWMARYEPGPSTLVRVLA